MFRFRQVGTDYCSLMSLAEFDDTSQDMHERRLPSLKSVPDHVLQPFVVEKVGEMPDTGPVKSSSTPTPALLDHNSRPPSPASSFRTRELADHEVRPSTPDAIKVVHPKKKGSAVKKKRTTKVEALE
jgi:hypothetical protein